jgi:hypothetical protein
VTLKRVDEPVSLFVDPLLFKSVVINIIKQLVDVTGGFLKNRFEGNDDEVLYT